MTTPEMENIARQMTDFEKAVRAATAGMNAVFPNKLTNGSCKVTLHPLSGPRKTVLGRKSESTDVVVIDDPPRSTGVLGVADGHATAFCVMLPLPPSTNRLWRRGRAGGQAGGATVTYKSAEYTRWRSAAAWSVKVALNAVKGLAGAYALRVRAIRPDEVGRDLDNLLKPLCDALVDGGAIASDKLARKIEIEWVTAEDLGGVGEGMEILLLATTPLPVATNKTPAAVEARKAKARTRRSRANKPAKQPIKAAADHDVNCDWQHDQYDFECTCGATKPRHPDFIPYTEQA